MPMKWDDIKPSTSKCTLDLQEFAFKKRDLSPGPQTVVIEQERDSTLEADETERLINKKTGVVERCSPLLDHCHDKQSHFTPSASQKCAEGTMSIKSSGGVRTVVSDSEPDSEPSPVNKLNLNTVSTEEFKSKLRKNFTLFSKDLTIPPVVSTSVKTKNVQDQIDDSVSNNLAMRIQKKWQRLLVTASSDEESPVKNGVDSVLKQDSEEQDTLITNIMEQDMVETSMSEQDIVADENSNDGDEVEDEAVDVNTALTDDSQDSETEYKESCLTQLHNAFPRRDVMELQDVLVENDWSVENSLQYLKNLAEYKRHKVKRKCVVNSDSSDPGSSNTSGRKRGIGNSKSRGVVFVSEESEQEAEADMNMRRRVRRLDRERNSLRSKRRKLSSLADGNVGDDEGEASYCIDNDIIYDSDASDIDDTMTPARDMVLTFFQTATFDELIGVPNCSRKKAEAIIEMRPFKDWVDLVTKFRTSKGVSTDFINGAKDILNSRKVVIQLMKKCEEIASRMEEGVARLLNGNSEECAEEEGHLKEQPPYLNPEMKLAPYQMLGLNWLILVHQHRVNGILADEMGLGKTIQAISFLAYLMSEGDDGPHLIVVPASTMDNWVREINTWWPSAYLLLYRGAQEDRRYLRQRILKGKEDGFTILLTTYSMVTSNAEDRSLFKKVRFHYVVFDEAHLLKNMETQRYQNLIKIKTKHRLLLTGTPLQNNLVELMSLLVFVMPNLFDGKIEHLKSMFAMASKDASEEAKGSFERDRIDQAKRIMKPFVLRRLKNEVLDQLPKKTDEVLYCALSLNQREKYDDLIFTLSQQLRENRGKELYSGTSGIGMMMQLRKLSNHPLLLRYHYSDEILRKMAKLMLKEPSHHDANSDLVFEDMQVMSDFELHKLCEMYRSISTFSLQPHHILDSGKFLKLNTILAEKKSESNRVLLFSQFVMVLDIIEEYMKIQEHSYLRLDGSTPVSERQELIDRFSSDDSIFVFLLSTRAGGLGINLTAANTVILHDIDFNPYNDKQAEDRCHRIGQTKAVQIIRLISKDTIEEGILSAAQRKLKLESDIISSNSVEGADEANDVASLLKEALGL